jgi:hypothetical protein
MSAFNWIVFDDICPACGQHATIEAQTHTAAAYGGDDSGRFHDRCYGIGQVLAWWPPSDPRYDQWRNRPMTRVGDDGRVLECCYATCRFCGAELWTIVEFVDLVPVRVIASGKEENWPDNFPK